MSTSVSVSFTVSYSVIVVGKKSVVAMADFLSLFLKIPCSQVLYPDAQYVADSSSSLSREFTSSTVIVGLGKGVFWLEMGVSCTPFNTL